MSSTNFINQQTVIQADWLNDINGVNYNLLGTGTAVPTTKADLMTNLGALNRANNLSDVVSASDARFNIGVTATGADTTYLFRANNLSDLGSVSTARTNLGVTATGADTTYLFRANNLSDLASVSTARTNLGLGSAALLTAGTSANNAVQLDGSAKLPAVDGSQLTNLPGGMTLLGTITTTASNSLSLGSLNLTSYKSLYIVSNAISTSSTKCAVYVSSSNLQTGGGYSQTNGSVYYGTSWLDLGTSIIGGAINTANASISSTSSASVGGLTNVTTASTTIYFRQDGTNTFTTGGSFVIYGVK